MFLRIFIKQLHFLASIFVHFIKIVIFRHQLNLQNSLIDVPDVIWDDEVLSNVYLEVSEYV